jgi:hypothetical protein
VVLHFLFLAALACRDFFLNSFSVFFFFFNWASERQVAVCFIIFKVFFLSRTYKLKRPGTNKYMSGNEKKKIQSQRQKRSPPPSRKKKIQALWGAIPATKPKKKSKNHRVLWGAIPARIPQNFFFPESTFYYVWDLKAEKHGKSLLRAIPAWAIKKPKKKNTSPRSKRSPPVLFSRKKKDTRGLSQACNKSVEHGLSLSGS